PSSLGYTDVQTLNQDNSTNKQYYLLPNYGEEGSLYIGIRNLQPPQNISILFQMIVGSGNGEIPQPPINWSYLSGNSWREFQDTERISDSYQWVNRCGNYPLEYPRKSHQ
ncbi:MAG: hypothetical protein HC907_34210, partial [Richelia sp. SM1_7_0]|nr:hypothetical protein [Richelia sp. SM1_7_0]